MAETSGILVGFKLGLMNAVSPNALLLNVIAMQIPENTANAAMEISNSGASFVGFTSLVNIYNTLMSYFCFPQRVHTDLAKTLKP